MPDAWRDKLVHLGVGALLVLGYYAGLPGHLWESASGFRVSAPGHQAAPAPAALPPRAGTAPAWVRLPEGDLLALWAEGDTLMQARLDTMRGTWSATAPVADAADAAPGWLAAGFVPQWVSRGALIVHGVSDGTYPALTRLVREADGSLRYTVGQAAVPLPGQALRLTGPALTTGNDTVWLPAYSAGRAVIYRVDASGVLLGRDRLAPRYGAVTMLAESEQAVLRLLAPASGGQAFWQASTDGGARWSMPAPLEILEDVTAQPIVAARLGAGDWGLLVQQGDGALVWHRGQEGGQQWRPPVPVTTLPVTCLHIMPALAVGADGRLHLLYPTGEACALTSLAFLPDGSLVQGGDTP